jgi:hypothetical protein
MEALGEAIVLAEEGRLTPLITHRVTVDGVAEWRNESSRA